MVQQHAYSTPSSGKRDLIGVRDAAKYLLHGPEDIQLVDHCRTALPKTSSNSKYSAAILLRRIFLQRSGIEIIANTCKSEARLEVFALQRLQRLPRSPSQRVSCSRGFERVSSEQASYYVSGQNKYSTVSQRQLST